MDTDVMVVLAELVAAAEALRASVTAQVLGRAATAPPRHTARAAKRGGWPISWTGGEGVRVCDLVDAVRQLANHHVKSPALILRTPEGEYVVSPDGTGGGAHNRFVISRSQLATLMWENGMAHRPPWSGWDTVSRVERTGSSAHLDCHPRA
jgi:hypothetical protein